MAELIVRVLPPITERVIERHWKNTERRGDDECWPWKGSINQSGYGQISIGPHGRNQIVRAHRIAYFLGHGVDPAPFLVCHKCDFRLCQNPSHLFLGSLADNLHDCQAKGRMQSGESHHTQRHPERVQRGDKCPFAKLKEADVIEIRRLYATGEWYYHELAAMFDVSKSSVHLIVQRRNWRHVT